MDIKILLLLIVFNLVVAYFKRRAKKRKEMEARAGSSAGATVATATEAPTQQANAPQRRESPSWASQHESDEVEQDWDETNSSDYEDIESENPYRETARPAPQSNTSQPQKAIPKPPVQETGKDLLSQLAKELGLEIPQRPQPQPPPRPIPIPSSHVPSRESASKAAIEESLRNKRATAGYDDHSRTVADSAPGADLTSAPSIAAVESANASAYAARETRRSSVLATLRSDLFDAESLQRAFVLKTVLDRPLTLQDPARGFRS